MSLVKLPNETYSIVCKSGVILGIICITSISTYHVISIKKHDHFLPYSKHVYLSMIFLLLSIYTIINLTVEIFQTEQFCGYNKYVAIPSYIAYKCVLYFILVNRIKQLYESFGPKTQYGVVSNTGLIIWRTFILIWSLANITLIITTSSIKFSTNTVPKCVITVWRPVLIMMALLDVVACICNAYLFAKPVIKLHKLINQNGLSKNNNACSNLSNLNFMTIKKSYESLQTSNDINQVIEIEQLKYNAIKQCVLSIITVSTTVIAMLSVAMFSMEQIFISLDVNVTTFCIILMYKWNAYLVDRLCCWCVKPLHYQKNQSVVKQPQQANDSIYLSDLTK
eukprot:267299_1